MNIVKKKGLCLICNELNLLNPYTWICDNCLKENKKLNEEKK